MLKCPHEYPGHGQTKGKGFSVLRCFQWSRGIEVGCDANQGGVKAPSSNLQAPEKHQGPNFKKAPERVLIGRKADPSGRRQRAIKVCLEVEVWRFSGAWSLDVGASVMNGSTENSEEPQRRPQAVGGQFASVLATAR
jgi:hypothetical protein